MKKGKETVLFLTKNKKRENYVGFKEHFILSISEEIKIDFSSALISFEKKTSATEVIDYLKRIFENIIKILSPLSLSNSSNKLKCISVNNFSSSEKKSKLLNQNRNPSRHKEKQNTFKEDI